MIFLLERISDMRRMYENAQYYCYSLQVCHDIFAVTNRNYKYWKHVAVVGKIPGAFS